MHNVGRGMGRVTGTNAVGNNVQCLVGRGPYLFYRNAVEPRKCPVDRPQQCAGSGRGFARSDGALGDSAAYMFAHALK